MAAGLWSTNGAALAYASSAFGDFDPQVRGVSLAMVNALGNLSQIYGSVGFMSSGLHVSRRYLLIFSPFSIYFPPTTLQTISKALVLFQVCLVSVLLSIPYFIFGSTVRQESLPKLMVYKVMNLGRQLYI